MTTYLIYISKIVDSYFLAYYSFKKATCKKRWSHKCLEGQSDIYKTLTTFGNIQNLSETPFILRE